ncbi:hypothetical protein [Streptomyces mirabilis]|jgi:hypothetical protein|uniref:Lipoprotein n=1 Tax=Streptomyces mirabilis TaxID=68239 RepID=A0A1I1ZRK1_9ACTN|nr:hypothetical protein [Streptomyces mirabilis]SFE34286.1 hypothetical protein SAMN02787118_101389 [Streptomyces mirabilis]
MKQTLTITGAVLLLATLAACSNTKADASGTPASPDAAKHASPEKQDSSASKPPTASTAFDKISATVTSAKLSGTVTAENDPNHLLGRPSQYTSKVTFSDSRISADDVSGTDKGDVDRGGAIESFASPSDAKARAEYIQAVTKSMPALSEYDYVQGTTLVRVSHYLTPKQAGEYKAAAADLD